MSKSQDVKIEFVRSHDLNWFRKTLLKILTMPGYRRRSGQDWEQGTDHACKQQEEIDW